MAQDGPAGQQRLQETHDMLARLEIKRRCAVKAGAEYVYSIGKDNGLRVTGYGFGI